MLPQRLPYPKIKSVPCLFLWVDTVCLGSANSIAIGLVSLFKVDELKRTKHNIWNK